MRTFIVFKEVVLIKYDEDTGYIIITLQNKTVVTISPDDKNYDYYIKYINQLSTDLGN